MRAKIATNKGEMHIFDAVDVVDTPFIVHKLRDFPCWVLTHKRLGYRMGSFGWSSQDLAITSAQKWWSILSDWVRSLLIYGSAKQIQNMDWIISAALRATSDCDIEE